MDKNTARQIVEYVLRESPPDMVLERVVEHVASMASTPARTKASEEDALRVLRQCVEAMEQLTDFQNGPPLDTYEKGWNLGMDMCAAATASARKLIGEPPNG